MATQIRGNQIKQASVAADRLVLTDIATVGTITSGTWNGSTIAVANGGTGATSASDARTNLGLVIGTDVQAYNSTLASVAGGTYAGDDSIVTVGTITAGTWQGAQIGASYLPKLNSITAPDGSLSLNSQKITSLAEPTSGTDAATKQYVDNALYLRSVKEPARVRSQSDVTISSPGASVDGVSMVAGDRVLLTAQTAGSENGIYVWNGAAVAMTRAVDADSDAEMRPNHYLWVEEGTSADQAFVCTNDGTITLGTTALSYTKFSGLGQITAGNGLTKTGNTLDVGAGNGIQVDADSITVKIDGSTLAKSGSGLKVASAGITATELASSVAGDGLTGGAGSALAVASGNGGIVVNANDITLTLDGSTLSVGASGLKVASSGITATQLATSVVASGGGLTGGAGTGLSVQSAMETPSGSVNGDNVEFTLAHTPKSGTLLLFRNGMLQDSSDYSLSTATITFSSAPASGDSVRAFYLW